MTDTENAAAESSERPIRDEDGAIDSRLVEQVSQALLLSDLTTLRSVVADMHEADLGALLEALDAEERTRLISLLGRDFDDAFLAIADIHAPQPGEGIEHAPARQVLPEPVEQGFAHAVGRRTQARLVQHLEFGAFP